MASDRRMEEARQAYGRAVEAVRAAFKERSGESLVAEEGLILAADSLLDSLGSKDQHLLSLTARSTAGNYLYAHSVNVAVLAMHIARGLKWEHRELRALGLCGLSLDIERIKRFSSVKDVLPKEPQEVQETRLHPVDSWKIFEHLRGVEGALRGDFAEPFSHRLDESKEENLTQHRRRPVNQGAHILALCDIYEAMSHWRDWREPILPHDALMSLLKQHRRESDQRLIKVFAQRLSLYPPGSYVLLSSEEVARVVEVHPTAPTRPTVAVLVRPDGERCDPPRIVNLASDDHFNIANAIDESKLRLKDKRLALQLAAQRWWTA